MALILHILLVLLITPIQSQVFSTQHPVPTTTKRLEKLTHLHFYFHDIVSGLNPTSVQITGPLSSPYAMGFGNTMMADDALTLGLSRQSEIIGRAQGLYSVASQSDEFAFLMVMNYEFTKGKFKGSSISILGRNSPMDQVREMPIVGGTGLFRFARGYVLAHTVWANSKGDATVEYHVYVYHF